MMIDRFVGKYRFLSNFWPAEVIYNGASYPTVEHAYQAAKTFDVTERRLIRSQSTPGKAKRVGRSVTIRSGWDVVKLHVMRELVGQKFRLPELKKKLIQTGQAELIEGNTWGDTFWGVCNGEGQNHLGRILMEIRRTCCLKKLSTRTREIDIM